MDNSMLKYFKTIGEIQGTIANATTLEEALQGGLKVIVESAGAAGGAIWYADKAGDGALHPYFWIGPVDLTRRSHAPGDGSVGRVFESQRAERLFEFDATQDVETAIDFMGMPVTSMVCVPFSSQTDDLGVVQFVFGVPDGDPVSTSIDVDQGEKTPIWRDFDGRMRNYPHNGEIVRYDGVFALLVQIYQRVYVCQGVVQPGPQHAQQQEVFRAAPQSFLDGVDRIRIVLDGGQHDGLDIGIRLLMGVEIPDDEIRFSVELFLMFQPAVAVDDEIVVPQQRLYSVVSCDRRTADDDAAFHYSASQKLRIASTVAFCCSSAEIEAVPSPLCLP